ncbi:MAG: hypothetical protein PHC68_14420 [Syntrophorhabdaceae bacterium]|nr:hypothetical protein [Syntrophorhabdaceae bacterium]
MTSYNIVDIATGNVNLGSFLSREEAEAGLMFEREHGVLSKSFDGEGERGEEFEIVERTDYPPREIEEIDDGNIPESINEDGSIAI